MSTGDKNNQDEMAAALAAIYMYCSLQKKAEEKPSHALAKENSSWSLAARLEACRLAPQSLYGLRGGQSLWALSSRLKNTLCAFLLASSSAAIVSPASAQDQGFSEANGTAYRDRQTNFAVQDQCPRKLRVALSVDATTCNIIVPDGADLIDQTTKELLAELPPQSRWQVGLEDSPTNATRQIAFSGQIGNMAATQVLLSKSPSLYKEAGFSFYGEERRNAGGFKQQPYVLDDLNPKFALPLTNPYSGQAFLKQPPRPGSAYRPIAYVGQNQEALSYAAPLPSPTYLLKPLNADGVFSLNGKVYRGQLLIEPSSTNAKVFSLINLVDLEDYLLSVVPSEMPNSWNAEALKAQTIAARSYAIANLGKHEKAGYDLKATTEDQVYNGVQTENEATNKAVTETQGLVIKHNAKVVSAFFHSSAGGFTETSENVWTKSLPYLQSVPDFDDQSPHFAWNRQLSLNEMEERLFKSGIDVGGLLGVFPLSRSDAQRVKLVLISGSLQSLVVSGEEMRKIFTLPSTMFNVVTNQDGYSLSGRGFGHGLGMSQWGAKCLADTGYNAAQILSYYYRDISIEPAW